MKLIASVLIATFLFAGSQSNAQTVTISVKDARLETVLNQVKKQTGYTFFYNESILKKAGKVTMSVQNATIDEALKACFADQRLLQYSIVGTTVVVKEKTDTQSPEYIVVGSAPYTINGKILNAGGKGLSNANVVLKRTQKGAITNAKGEFSIDKARATDTLLASYVGYTAMEAPVNAQVEITITLKEATDQLDEVVMRAYGTTSQRLITGNITKINSAEIQKQPVMNPLMALQGRVPGLVVTPTSGFSSAPVRMEIRGLNSLNSRVPSDPLYVIDGVPLTVLSIGNATINRISMGLIQSVGDNFPSASTTRGQSPLFGLNPQDIESIEILKDADATAVYGARGSNGVILITTKKGKAGKTKFDFNINPPVLSIGKTTRYIKTMNTQQYLQMRREAFKNEGAVPTLLNAPDLLFWDTTRYTDWQKEMLGGRAKLLEVSAGVSGGSEQAVFRINANYTRQTNTTNISGSTQRATLGTAISTTSQNQKFSLDLSANFAYSLVDVVAPVFNSILAPNAPAIFNKNGDPNWAEWSVNGLFGDNGVYPFGQNLLPANPQSTNFLASSLQLQYKLFKGVTLSAILGYNFSYNSTNEFVTIASKNPYQQNITGEANFSTTQNSGWTINPQITYKTRLGRGNLQLRIVATEQAAATNGINLQGVGYTNDILLNAINNAATIYTESGNGKAKNASFVGEVNYEWEAKYILNLTGTRQGSSKFGPDNKYGNFGSAGVAWIASEEKWLKSSLPAFVSFLKFRGSYGLTGGDGVADYQYLPLWQFQGAGVGGYNGRPTLAPSVRPNQKYRWENNEKMEGAMDINLLKDRISLNVVYYKNRVTNQLTTYPTPTYINTLGVTGIVTNIPLLLQNSGWEGGITASLVQGVHFSLSAGFNISRNRNKLLSFPDLEKTPYNGQYAVGQSLNMVYLYHYLGVDPLTGRASVQDFNNDGRITTSGFQVPTPGSDDRGVSYDLQPSFNGGFSLSGNYRKLSFSLFFNYKKQMARNIYSSIGAPGTFNRNIPPEILDNHWQQPGDIAMIPASSLSGNPWYNLAVSDFIYSDGSFIRLNNVYLAYPLPEAWGKKIGLKNLVLSLSGQNVFIITRYKGGDPETTGYGSPLPPANLYTVRVNYNF